MTAVLTHQSSLPESPAQQMSIRRLLRLSCQVNLRLYCLCAEQSLKWAELIVNISESFKDCGLSPETELMPAGLTGLSEIRVCTLVINDAVTDRDSGVL
jgi:hypothetical protein